jgi:hypothetical protein
MAASAAAQAAGATIASRISFYIDSSMHCLTKTESASS